MTSPAPDAVAARAPGLTWSWAHALIGVIYSLPSALACLQDPEKGLPLAIGVIPAILIGIPARRRSRIIIVFVGLLAGVSIFVGGLIAQLPAVLTAVLLAIAVIAAAVAASALPAGRVVLSLCAPLVAVGLSFDDIATSTETLLLLAAGAAYAWLVSLAWPGREMPAARRPQLPDRRSMVEYGARMGVAAAIGYLIAVAANLDHPGWAPAACLLVARPQVDLLQARGVGRLVAVIVGAGLALALVELQPPDAVYAACAIVLLGCAAATAGSRWYITAGFTSFFVILLLAGGNEAAAIAKTNERVMETGLGVLLAYAFGWALPALRTRIRP